MKNIFLFVVTISLTTLTSCSGGGGSDNNNDTIDVSTKSGDYAVEVVESAASGDCTKSDAEINAVFNGMTKLGQNADRTVSLSLPGVNATLLGNATGNRILTAGGFPIASNEAAVIESTWTESNTESFDVKYTYTETFNDIGNNCYREFDGNAVLPN